MESQPQNPESRNNPENFHPCNIQLIKNNQLIVMAVRKLVSKNCLFLKKVSRQQINNEKNTQHAMSLHRNTSINGLLLLQKNLS